MLFQEFDNIPRWSLTFTSFLRGSSWGKYWMLLFAEKCNRQHFVVHRLYNVFSQTDSGAQFRVWLSFHAIPLAKTLDCLCVRHRV